VRIAGVLDHVLADRSPGHSPIDVVHEVGT
jgi:hypothetical protein